MSKQPKLTVTVGEADSNGLNGTTLIDGEFPVTVTWHLGITNFDKWIDDEGFEETQYSDRFVANPPKKVLGKHYKRIRETVINACKFQSDAEGEARGWRPDATRRRETETLKAQLAADGVTIVLNQTAIDATAQKTNEPSIDLTDVLGF
jgi:hypothetical protein